MDIAANTQLLPVWQVVVMGLCTVFVCLIALIYICKITGFIINRATRKSSAAPKPMSPNPVVAAPVVTPVSAPVAMPLPNKQALLAAIGVAIAEDLGTDISHLRIHSVRRLGAATVATAQSTVAAIGVAVAESMGTDPSHIKIHSIKKI